MKTQKLLKSALLLTTVIIFSACEKLDTGLGITGQGPMMEEEYHFQKFKNIEVDVNANVYLTQSYFQPILIKGQLNILDNLIVTLENETLKINYIESVNTHERLEIFISLPTLENLSTARGAFISSANAFASNHLVFQVYGSGTINMNVDFASLIRSRVTGTGRIVLNGKAEMLDVVINGSGSVSTSTLITQHSTVNITGSGKCEVNSHEELSVNINGNGKVFYAGNPTTVNSSLSGNGELRQMQ
jgi:hypothetical protein